MTQVLKKFDMDELLNCMHCGFCLPTCPTYQQTGMETYSPRGRIGLMKGVAEEKLPLDDEFAKNMYACLGCRACETACPAGVRYGSLIETAREVIEGNHKANGKRSVLREVVFRKIFNQPARIRKLGTLLWAAQLLGLQKLANKTGIMQLFPKPMAEMQDAVGRIASPKAHHNRGRSAVSEDASGPRVGLFTGCIMDEMFFETNQAMARILTKAGCQIVFVENQACCGALHAHSGEKEEAIELAKRNIAAFEAANVDFMINDAGGCGAALKEYTEWLKADVDWYPRASRFVSKTRDFNEFLVELPPLHFTKSISAKVTYQDSCHLAHGQGIRQQPRDLIQSIPGIQFVELARADSCCGSAGIYNITNFDMSMQILDTKMKNVAKTKANIIVTSNPGCLLQMRKGIVREGLEQQVEAVHIVDLLDRAL